MSMMILGYERSNFTTKDDTKITGYSVYVSREIDPERGEGNAVERVYLTDKKLSASNVDLEGSVGREIVIYYNRYGKPERIVLGA